MGMRFARLVQQMFDAKGRMHRNTDPVVKLVVHGRVVNVKWVTIECHSSDSSAASPEIWIEGEQ
jgi:hypothetical protein